MQVVRVAPSFPTVTYHARLTTNTNICRTARPPTLYARKQTPYGTVPPDTKFTHRVYTVHATGKTSVHNRYPVRRLVYTPFTHTHTLTMALHPIMPPRTTDTRATDTCALLMAWWSSVRLAQHALTHSVSERCSNLYWSCWK